MTTRPKNINDVRTLLINHLNIDTSTYRHADLEADEVGIVGSDAHKRTGTSYHLGKVDLKLNLRPYSVYESSRDERGLTSDAAALDIGWFEVTVGGKKHTLFTFNAWVVGECERGVVDTLDIREIIYTLDGKTVKRWDRLKRRSSGDSSHLYHTHFSFFRDAIKAGRDLRPLFRRYLIHIGLIKEDDMFGDKDRDNLNKLVKFIDTTGWADTVRLLALLSGTPAKYTLPGAKESRVEANRLAESLARIEIAATAAAGRDFNEGAIVEGVLAGLGARPEPEVAQALVAAGQDPQRLAEALLALSPKVE